MQDRVSKRKDFRTIEKYCAFCGKKLERRYFPGCNKFEDMKHFKQRKYCDRLCMRKAFTNVGNNNSNWSNTHSTARTINELFLHKNKCEICNKAEKLDIHHVDKNPNNNNAENLMCLCRSCHMKIHHPKSICKIDGCERQVKGYGYCDLHYQRFKKTGNPLLTKLDLRKGGDAHE